MGLSRAHGADAFEDQRVRGMGRGLSRRAADRPPRDRALVLALYRRRASASTNPGSGAGSAATCPTSGLLSETGMNPYPRRVGTALLVAASATILPCTVNAADRLDEVSPEVLRALRFESDRTLRQREAAGGPAASNPSADVLPALERAAEQAARARREAGRHRVSKPLSADVLRALEQGEQATRADRAAAEPPPPTKGVIRALERADKARPANAVSER